MGHALDGQANGEPKTNGWGWFSRKQPVDTQHRAGSNGQANHQRPESGLQRTIPARGGRIQALRIINELLRQTLQPGHPPQAASTDLSRLIESAQNTIKRRSLVFVVSDFISKPGWERALALLNQRHEVLAIRITDPRELELPDVGPVMMEDAETGEQMYVDTHDKGFRTRFQEAVQRREAALNQAFKRAGVDVWSLSTEEDLVRAIIRFASIRKQHRSGAGSSASNAVSPALTSAAGSRQP